MTKQFINVCYEPTGHASFANAIFLVCQANRFEYAENQPCRYDETLKRQIPAACFVLVWDPDAKGSSRVCEQLEQAVKLQIPVIAVSAAGSVSDDPALDGIASERIPVSGTFGPTLLDALEAALSTAEERDAERTKQAKNYIFLSYCSANIESAEVLYRLMQQAGIRVWMALYEIAVSDSYHDILAEQIDGCAGLAALVTKEWQHALYCRNEMDYLISRKSDQRIFALVKSDEPPEGGTQLMLKSIQLAFFDEISAEDAGVQKFIRDIAAFLAAR